MSNEAAKRSNPSNYGADKSSLSSWFMSLLKEPRVIGAVLTPALTGIGTVCAAIRDHPIFASWILGIGLSISTLILLFVKVPPRIAGVKEKQPAVRKPFYRKSLWAASIIIALIPVVYTVVAYWLDEDRGKTIILVADFDGPDNDYAVTQIIIGKLREALRDFPEAKVKALRETITAKDDSTYARKVAKEHKASILIWGMYRGTRSTALVDANVEILREIENAPISKPGLHYELPVAKLDSFQVHDRLASETSYISLIVMGVLRYEAKDYDGSIERFSKALDQPAIPDDFLNRGVAHLYRGDAYSKKGEYKKSIPDYSHAVDHLKTPKDSKEALFTAFFNRGNAYCMMDRDEMADKDEKAIDDYNAALKLNPESPLPYNNLGVEYARKGKHDDACKMFKEAVSRDSKKTVLYVNLAGELAELGQTDEAMKNADKALDLDSTSATGYYCRGGVYYRRKKYDNAIADFDKAISIKSDFAFAYHSRGLARSALRFYRFAIEDQTRAIKYDSSMAPAYYYRAAAMLALRGQNPKGQDPKELDLAIDDYKKSIALQYKVPESFTGLGDVYSIKQDDKLALHNYDLAIVHEPNYALAYYERSAAYHRMGKDDKAISDCRKVLMLPAADELKGKARQRLQRLEKRQGVHPLG